MGGTITMPVSFDYIPAMKKSELWLGFEVTNKKGTKTYSLERVKVADGIIATAELADVNKVKPAIAADAFQRIINETCNADIMFLIQQANIRSKQLKSEEMAALNAKVNETKSDDRKELKGIEISSYASPDGGYELNYKLAEKREDNTMKYLNKQLKKDTINTEVIGKFTAQDWDGFKTLVEKSSIQDKELILRVLGQYQDPEQREAEIKNLSAAYKELANDILPKLRRSHLTLTVKVTGKTDEEIIALAKSNPDTLNVEELMFAATIAETEEDAAQFIASAAEIYAADWRTVNNLGAQELAGDNYANATANLDKAAAASEGEQAEINFNNALISMINSDYAKAEELLAINKAEAKRRYAMYQKYLSIDYSK
jgi:hypothetical protein